MATKKELQEELAHARARLEEAEETLRAIRQGEVDAILVSTPEGEQIFTLKGADHTFRVLVETINEGAATLDPQGIVIYANRVLASMLKMPLQRLIGSSFLDYVPRGERQWFEALLARAKQEPNKGEVSLLSPGGALVPTYLSLGSIQVENVPEAVCLAVTDLTEQKRQEEILAQGRLARAILEQAEHAIVVCDARGIVIQASRAAHKLLGGNPLLRHFADAFPLSLTTCEPTSGRLSVEAFSPATVLRGQVYQGVEAIFKPGPGQELCLLLDAGPIAGEDSTVLGCVIILTDITARKQQEVERQKLLERQQALTEELTATNEELTVQTEELAIQRNELEKLNHSLHYQKKLLEDANQELEAFTYSVSHDLKVPVRAIQGFSRMLLKEHADKLDAEGDRLLNVVVDNTRIMHNLIDDLLSLSRLGRTKLRKRVINLAVMVEQIFKDFQSQAPKRDLRLMLGDLPPALGDQSLLHQVIVNLLANAVKFTKTRKTALFEVGGRTEGRENIYFVKDNGVGFDERYAENLFRPFQRLHSPKEGYEGTGVGLAIVQRIIHRHGGRVWAEGRVGEGATFFFALPAKEK